MHWLRFSELPSRIRLESLSPKKTQNAKSQTSNPQTQNLFLVARAKEASSGISPDIVGRVSNLGLDGPLYADYVSVFGF